MIKVFTITATFVAIAIVTLFALTPQASATHFEHTTTFGGFGTGDGKLKFPKGIAVNDTHIFVVDSDNKRIQIFTLAGAYVNQFGSLGTGEGQFSNPVGIAVNDTHIFVTDITSDRVQIFTLDGTYAGQFGSSGAGNGQFSTPIGIAVNSTNIFVTDITSDRVQIFTLAGGYLNQFGSLGTGNGQFSNPSGIAVNSENIFVIDSVNDRVQIFDITTYSYTGQFGGDGTGDGQFSIPAGIAVNSENIFVLDEGNNNVQAFTLSGTYIHQFGSSGSSDGQFNIPIGIAASDTSVFTTQKGGNKVQIFAIPSILNPSTDTTPVFTNAAAFATPISVDENTTAVGAAGFFIATATPGPIVYTLNSGDSNLFSISDDGTLTFNVAPNFERPRRMDPSAGNTNTYTLAITANNGILVGQSGTITVEVTDANDAPVFLSLVPPTFTEYSEGTITLPVTDVDHPTQTLTYSFLGDNHGATIDGNTFRWTPGEDDGDVLRIFAVRVVDSGNPPMRATRAFNITAEELPNRAPTGATITGPTTVTDGGTIALEATGIDPDTGDVLEYTWSVITADGGAIAPLTGTNVVYTPPTLTTPTRAITVRVTVSDGTLNVTDDHMITVSQVPITATGFNLAITTPSTSTVTEGGAAQNVTVTATTVPANTTFITPTIINVVVSGTTGTTSSADGTNADFTDVDTFTITIPANQTSFSHTFALTTTADTIPEGASIGLSPETITLTGTSGSLPSDTVTLTIVDDDEFSSLDFGGDNKVTSNDGLILYLVASGVNASALAIFVDGPGTTSAKIDRLAALQARIDTENTGS